MYKKIKHAKFMVFVLLGCLALCAAVRFGDVPVNAENDDEFTLIIDAGHGGLDGGAVSESGLKESDVNLAIAYKLRDVALLCGVNPVMTREDENSVHSPEAETVREQKVSDMRNRVALIENTPNAILVSIHQNSYPGASRGAQVFYRDGDEKSRKLAVKMQEALSGVSSLEKSRSAMPVSDGIYLFKNTHCTAVLAECGFLSDENDVKLLQSEEYKISTALGIMSALLSAHDFEDIQ